MKYILIIYSIHTEIVNVILIVYRNTRSMVILTESNTPFFDITAGVLQLDIVLDIILYSRISYVYILKTY